MKNMKTILIYVMLVISLLVMSVATTLALVTDEHSTSDSVIRFDKVSLMGDTEDGNGSRLSLTLDNVTGNGEVVFDKTINPEHYLMVKPTSDTAPCYIRFKIYFSLQNEELNEEFADILAYLNDPTYLYRGFELNNNENYAFKQSEDWIYLVTPEENSELLKVVTKEDNSTGYILSEKYVLNVDSEAEGKISDLSSNHTIILKVEVEAIQTYNLSGLTDEEMDEILDSSASEEDVQTIYGGATIKDYVQAIQDNYLEIIGNGTKSYPFTINNGIELVNLARKVNSGDNCVGVYYKLNKDINLVNLNWNPIGKNLENHFSGNFDGNGKIIRNLKVNSSEDYQGLFGYIVKANIANVTIDSSCEITSTGNFVAGICGYAYNSNISNCVNNANVTGNSYVGGICGKSYNLNDNPVFYLNGEDLKNTGSNQSITTVSNVSTSTNGFIGKCINMTSSTQHIELTMSKILSSQVNYTLEGWFKSDTWSVDAHLFTLYTGDTNRNWIRMNVINDTSNFFARAYKNESTLLEAVLDDYLVNKGQWFHISMVVKNRVEYFYINGKKCDNTVTVTKDYSKLFLGCAGVEDNKYAFKGYLDEFKIYDYVRYNDNFDPNWNLESGESSLLDNINNGTITGNSKYGNMYGELNN